ncbi:MAG: AraC family transcriptional regulator [Gemmatimonadaceae bacterium]
MAVQGGAGHFVALDGVCMLIGRSDGVVPEHAHYAIQVAFCSERGVGFRPGSKDAWTEYDGAIIRSRQPHTMDATRARAVAVIFVEPETREGRALNERYLDTGIAPLPPALIAELRGELFAAWDDRNATAVNSAMRRTIDLLTGGVQPSVVADERILRAVAFIKAHLDRPLTLDAVAEEACLSPSRFRHLFVEQTGMAMRPYILWRRFLLVWELLAKGESLSYAAHSAGFSDAAHLSRTSRNVFGFPPSALQMEAPMR